MYSEILPSVSQLFFLWPFPGPTPAPYIYGNLLSMALTAEGFAKKLSWFRINPIRAMSGPCIPVFASLLSSARSLRVSPIGHTTRDNLGDC